jgi:glycosyltransferase involved in cell wall biosynthesis
VPYRTWRPSRPANPAATAAAVTAPAADRPRHGWRQVVSELLDTPDSLWPWAAPAVAAARERLAKGDIQAILTTSPPETVHLIGRRLQREFNLPWVADLRDLWSCDHFRQRPGWKLALLRRLERHLLNRADGLVTVSPGFLETERQLLRPGPAQQRVIENGFDAVEQAAAVPTPYDRFTLLYGGKLHREFQDPRPVLEAIARLRQRRPLTASTFQAVFHLYGAAQPDLAGMATALGIADLVHVLPPVDPQTIVSHMRGAHALLFVHWNGPNSKGWFSGKIYDYLGARRPILGLGDPGHDVCRMLTDLQAGVVSEDADVLADGLERWFDEWQATGTVQPPVSEDRLYPLTRQYGTTQLAELLDTLVGSPSS